MSNLRAAYAEALLTGLKKVMARQSKEENKAFVKGVRRLREDTDFDTFKLASETEHALSYLRESGKMRRKQSIASVAKALGILALAVDYLYKVSITGTLGISICIIAIIAAGFYYEHDLKERCERFNTIFSKRVKELLSSEAQSAE